jgi:hypothetical protein
MGSAVFALVFLSSGYLLLRRWAITRPHALGWDGHALYFSVVIASVILAVEADLFREIVERTGAVGASVNGKIWRVLATLATDSKFTTLGVTAVWSVPIAALSVVVLNRPIARCAFLRLQLYLRLSCLGELEEFLLLTSARNQPVMITLKNNKVYVGFSLEANASRGKKEWLRLEPLLSGYRDETQQFQDTTDYSWLHIGNAHERFRREEFDIIVPSSEIVSAHAFDLDVYVSQFRTPPIAGTPKVAAEHGQAESADDEFPDDRSDQNDDRGSSSRVERSSAQPRTTCEILYWVFCSAVALIIPAAYLFGLIWGILLLFLSAVLALASSIDGD